MKKKLFLWAVFAVMMAFTACTQEKVVYVEEENDMNSSMQLEGNMLKISLSNGLSRAVRPIYDNEAANNINKIGLKFYDRSTNQEITEISIKAVDNSLTYENNVITINNDCPESVSITLDMEKAKNRDVIFFAYGYNDKGGDEFSFDVYSDNGAIQTDNKKDQSVLLYNESLTNENVQEYFAGYDRAIINSYGLFNDAPEITLNRQVAGLLVYLKNVPATINNDKGEITNVGYITVNAAKEIQGLMVPAEALDDNSRYSNENYANGYEVKENNNGEVLLEFDLTGVTGTREDGIYYEFPKNADAGDNNVLFAEGMTASAFAQKKFAPHTLFGSCFILPFNHVTYNNTPQNTALFIQYLDDSGNVIQFKNENGTTVDKVALHLSSGSTSPYSYAVWSNHFYSIGTKYGNSIEDGDKDGYPDKGDDATNPTDEDNPLDISSPSGTGVLPLTVNDVWEDVSLIRPTSAGSSD